VNNAIETPSERDHPVPVVNTVERLMAIDAHPETLDTDLAVAVAIANGETTVEGIDQELVDDSIEELIAALRRNCSQGYKVPNEVRFEAIPKISTGKIQKFQLRERAKQRLGDRVRSRRWKNRCCWNIAMIAASSR
jgi:acyl-coenzyme A synthetase/AMP-(fatty) acid ligase